MHAFDLGATTIESLERAANGADFAVLLVTADDVLKIREETRATGRDNVTFEAGLFMGRLGRDRCFVVQEKRTDLRMPTDLLGVTTARFNAAAPGASWEVALAAASGEIAGQISKLGPKERLTPEFLAAQSAIRSFAKRVTGLWWERFNAEEKKWLSVIRIEIDSAHNSVRLTDGRGYDDQGHHRTNWESIVARTKDGDRIDYHWQGWYLDGRVNDRFHGFGEIQFWGGDRDSIAIRGRGKYWDVDEAHPKNTTVKADEFRRVTDGGHVEVLEHGRENEIRDLVTRVLRDW